MSTKTIETKEQDGHPTCKVDESRSREDWFHSQTCDVKTLGRVFAKTSTKKTTHVEPLWSAGAVPWIQISVPHQRHVHLEDFHFKARPRVESLDGSRVLRCPTPRNQSRPPLKIYKETFQHVESHESNNCLKKEHGLIPARSIKYCQMPPVAVRSGLPQSYTNWLLPIHIYHAGQQAGQLNTA